MHQTLVNIEHAMFLTNSLRHKEPPKVDEMSHCKCNTLSTAWSI